MKMCMSQICIKMVRARPGGQEGSRTEIIVGSSGKMAGSVKCLACKHKDLSVPSVS